MSIVMVSSEPTIHGRLLAACGRVRTAARPDDVLDVAAEEARVLAGAERAWAGRVDIGGPDGRATVIRTALASGAIPHASAAVDAPPPPPAFTALLASLSPSASSPSSPSSARASVTREDGLVCATLEGSTGTEGVLAVPHSDAATAPGFDDALAQLAIVTGLALEGARLRLRVEAVTRARELLLASVSHDLRNPLNTFAMSAGLLRDDLERNDVNATRGISLVSRMERATSRMQALIEDLVEASRIDARNIDYAIREESAAQIIKDAVAAAATPAGEKGATVAIESVEDDVRVAADRGRLLQIIAKVIAFETKSTGDGGTIKLGVHKHDGKAVFTARALGPGGVPVPPPEEGRGGLALLIARGLVEAQRGSFRIEGADGLIVAFTLPSTKS